MGTFLHHIVAVVAFQFHQHLLRHPLHASIRFPPRLVYVLFFETVTLARDEEGGEWVAKADDPVSNRRRQLIDPLDFWLL